MNIDARGEVWSFAFVWLGQGGGLECGSDIAGVGMMMVLQGLVLEGSGDVEGVVVKAWGVDWG